MRSKSRHKPPITRILLIDDDGADNFLHARVIRESGLVDQIGMFENAECALKLLRSESDDIDAIFVDINMPRMDGFAFLEALRQQSQPPTQLPLVVILSTSICADAIAAAKNFPASVITETKPLTIGKLKRIARQVSERNLDCSQANEPSTPSPIRVLSIEDDPHQARLLNHLLVQAPQQSYAVENAATLTGGVAMLAGGDFDVCLLDLGLPDGSGIDSLHQVRSVDGRIPIVVLTASDDETLSLSAIEYGAQDFIAKDALNGQRLSRSVRFAIARQRKMLGLSADANTDTLTGMPNRRQLNSSFTELMKKSDQLCVALLDLDHFKQVNDTYGHLVGDEVLKHLATVINETATDGTESARYGGEEFAILMPESSIDRAFEFVHGLLEKIADSTVESEDNVRVTASAGVYQARACDTLEDTIRRADIALYHAKRTGRNRVCVSDGNDPSEMTAAK